MYTNINRYLSIANTVITLVTNAHLNYLYTLLYFQSQTGNQSGRRGTISVGIPPQGAWRSVCQRCIHTVGFGFSPIWIGSHCIYHGSSGFGLVCTRFFVVGQNLVASSLCTVSSGFRLVHFSAISLSKLQWCWSSQREVNLLPSGGDVSIGVCLFEGHPYQSWLGVRGC